MIQKITPERPERFSGIFRIWRVDTRFLKDYLRPHQMATTGDYMKYQIIDINFPEDDPEIAQVAFVHGDEDVDDQEYILTITYDIHFFKQPADPFCRDSDWDYKGYTECDAEVIQVEIHKPKPETDGYSWGTGERVDNISVGDVMTTEDWRSIRRDIEDNYIEYMSNIREEI